MSDNLKPIRVSELDLSTKTEDTYFLGYEDDGDLKKSVQIPFPAIVKAANERRIAITFDTDEVIVPIGEPMKIYRTQCKGIDELLIRPFGTDNNATNAKPIAINSDTQFDLTPYMTTDAVISVKKTPKGTDNVIGTVYLFIKVMQ